MDTPAPAGPVPVDLNTLAMELRTLRDLLGVLSLQLSDMQFESDPAARTAAITQTRELLKSCQSQVT